jgi:hypothetical protein
LNRHQRRKYGSSLPPRRPPAGPRWQLYAIGLLVLAAVFAARVLSQR